MSRVLLIGLVLSATGIATAQQTQLPPAAPIAADTVEAQLNDQLKAQVRGFEAVLRAAVEDGGRRLAKRAQDLFPTAQIELAMDGDPVVLGMPHPDGGMVFTVQAPDIRGSYLAILNPMLRSQQRQYASPVATNPPPANPDPSLFDPDKEYGAYVREALIEAMIENSHPLNIAGISELVIVASVSDAVRRNPLNDRRLLILSVKGEYLTAYRQSRITKDDVRQRIVDRRF